MFSPDAVVPASVAARNPRRRQRTGSDDSVALRQNPKRIRRSGLSTETFLPPGPTQQDGLIERVAEEPLTNGHTHGPGRQRQSSLDTTGLAFRHRGVKTVDREKRRSRNDGGIELVNNPFSQTRHVARLKSCTNRLEITTTLSHSYQQPRNRFKTSTRQV